MNGASGTPGSSESRRRETRILVVCWLATLAASCVVFSAWMGRTPRENLHFVWVEAVMLATIPGKFAVFGGLAANSPLDPWGVALLGVAVDSFLALTLALCLDPILGLPGIGTWLRNAHDRTSTALADYPRLKRTAFWGAAFFVALPLPGSGWMGGTFAGQLLGLSRARGVAAIAVGTAMVTVTFAVLAELLGKEAESMLRSPWITVGGFLVFVLLAWLMWRKFQELLRRA
ncbi:MAG TPA: small multi-drug export protein [Planctomycetota bacterium]|jgi:uncharacterized membrane protein|nr:small multi-drug export protein [Planctomycetota bacterium]